MEVEFDDLEVPRGIHLYPERRQPVGDYRRLHRFTETTVERLSQMFLGENDGESHGGKIPKKKKMEIFLRHLADPGFQLGVAEDHGVSQPTVSRVFAEVLTAIAARKDDFIRFPSNAREMKAAMQLWHQRNQFPSAIGAIDCTHIRILKPKHNLHPEEYSPGSG